MPNTTAWSWRSCAATKPAQPPPCARISSWCATNMRSTPSRSRNLASPDSLLPIAIRRERSMASEKDPKHHTQKMKQRLQETVTHLREDIRKVDEPQLAAMFETSAEVLSGLVKAFDDYEKKNEAAWRKSA